MKLNIISIFALFTSFTSFADMSRYVTVTTKDPVISNSVSILQGETAEIVSARAETSNNFGMLTATIIKDGISITGLPEGYPTAGGAALSHGTVVAGPATIVLNSAYASLLTVKIIPQAYDPNKTLIIPPGTNQFNVTLETSTNLVLWADSTNGVYGSPDTARFFRIKMEKLTP